MTNYREAYPDLPWADVRRAVMQTLLGSTFVCKAENMHADGIDPLLVFEKDGECYGLSCSEAPLIGHAGQPWYSGLEEGMRDQKAWEEAEGRTVSWVGPGVEHANVRGPDHAPRQAFLVLMDDMGIAIVGDAAVLRADAESEDA